MVRFTPANPRVYGPEQGYRDCPKSVSKMVCVSAFQQVRIGTKGRLKTMAKIAA
jgi:hypothetical protein